MFRVVRVWEDSDHATFRFTAAKFDTKAEAFAHRVKLQTRFPGYLFWVTGGNTDRVMTIYKPIANYVAMSNADHAAAEADTPEVN